ncbi:hypothetical protein LOTGIDRAFT_172707 [Lottia gigantea]|uniref:Uncharacterized protein n=1 Tax=Lottia gigantea TaxID=225164 RepID=V4AB07_LOTGI|nr:hypothetical protein LOTGIDRAFT_172707 [Lottia gigantea]ESP01184.1 hypothetical protein LOTGIDRAFT_172707 [Lottia gigantea]
MDDLKSISEIPSSIWEFPLLGEGVILFGDTSEANKSLREVDYARVQAEMQSQMSALQSDFETILRDLKYQLQVKLSQELSDFKTVVSELESNLRYKDNKIDQLEDALYSERKKCDTVLGMQQSKFDNRLLELKHNHTSDMAKADMVNRSLREELASKPPGLEQYHSLRQDMSSLMEKVDIVHGGNPEKIRNRKSTLIVYHDRLKECIDRVLPIWLRQMRRELTDFDQFQQSSNKDRSVAAENTHDAMSSEDGISIDRDQSPDSDWDSSSDSEKLQEHDSFLKSTRSGRVRRRPRHLLGYVVNWDGRG